MINWCKTFFLLLALLLVNAGAQALECRPLGALKTGVETELRHSQGLLWQISKSGQQPSYLFGTMHVSDPEVTTLPEPVATALADSDVFVMEARLDTPEVMQFAQAMFFADGTRLSSLIDADLYKRAETILGKHGIPAIAVDTLKPWAAFITMNMPPQSGAPLDMILMAEAQAQGASVYGLESIMEQAAIFTDLPDAVQLQLLADSICHYDTIQNDMERMKSLYLARDLAGLYSTRESYELHEDAVYQTLLQSILQDRNLLMAERMQTYLKTGNAFVAVGALHLPGEAGILSLLEQAGYKVKSIY